MNYRKATVEDIDLVTDIVQTTKMTVFPKYYPKQVVDFFGQLHSRTHIEQDIKKGLVNILIDNGKAVGTGSFKGNHITRVYVLPEFQGKGYGTYILNQIENAIFSDYNSAYLDASLPACKFYENRGYKTVRHEELLCDTAVLVYAIMEKKLYQ